MMHLRLLARRQRATRASRRQAGLALAGMLFALVIFVLVQRSVVPRYSLVTPLDQAIPFIPLTWAAYVLFFPLVVAACAQASADAFDAFRAAVVMAFVLSIGCFALFPEIVPRPDPATIDNAFLRQRITRLWMIDLPSNGFPSLHVSVTCLACRMFWMTPYWRVVSVTGLLICLSTLTLKQHTLADVAAGVMVAVLCGILASKWQRVGVSHGHA